MPRIKPKSPSALEVIGTFIAGRPGLEDRRYREQTARQAQRDELDAQQAERERERHQLEIERVKRKRAEDEAAKLRADREAAAAREATRLGIERAREEMAAQERASGGGTDLDPKTKAMFDRAERLLPDLSEAAQLRLLEDLDEFATLDRITDAKDDGANRIANTIRDLGTSETDVSPLVAELQNAGALLAAAETPAQVAAALKEVGDAEVKSRQAVVSEHVKADTKASTIQTITDMLGSIAGKAKLVAGLSRSVQFGQMSPDDALRVAFDELRKTHGLKPPTAAEIASQGGDLDTIWQTPQGRQAASWMIGEARTRALKLLPQVVSDNDSTEKRQEALQGLMEREIQLVRAENGWYSSGRNAQPSGQPGAAAEATPTQAGGRKWKGAVERFLDRPPKVPLEQVREAIGSEAKPANSGKPPTGDDPEQTKAAIAQEIVKRAKERGWTKEQARAEYEKAIAEMGLGGGK